MVGFLTQNELEKDKAKPITVFLYIVVAYFLGLVARLSLAFEAQKHPEFLMPNDTIIPLWTADAGLYGYYAKLILSGNTLPIDSEHMLGHLIAWCVQMFGQDIDKVMFYLPAFVSPLLVVPIVLIMNTYKQPLVGFFAGLIASVGFNYYYRTHLGYTDTDLFIYTPVFLMFYAFIAATEKKNLYYALIGLFSMILLLQWYHSAKALIFGFMAIYVLLIAIFDRQKIENYFIFCILSLSLVPVAFYVKIILALGVIVLYRFLIKKYIKLLDYRIFLSIGAIALGIFALFDHPEHYYRRILDYIHKEDFLTFLDSAGQSFSVAATLKTVAESRGITWLDMINFTAGNALYYGVGVCGLVILTLHYRSAIFLWALMGLGGLSVQLGARFTTFAAPVIAIGVVFFIFWIGQCIAHKIQKKMAIFLKSLFLVLALAYPLWTMLSYNKLIKPVFSRDEVVALHTIASSTKSKNYIVSWWDNGWPLWYFTFLNTMIDNGKNLHDNFIVSHILLNPNPTLTANMTRYFYEHYEAMPNKGESVLTEVAKKENLLTTMEHLGEKTFELPPKSFEIYFFLNDATLDKLVSIEQFSFLSEALKPKNALLIYSKLIKSFTLRDQFVQGLDFRIDRKTGMITNHEGKVGKISGLFVSDGEKFQFQRFHKEANYNVIVYKNRDVLIVDDYYLNAFFMKAFVLNTFDTTLFELVSKSENAKIFRLMTP